MPEYHLSVNNLDKSFGDVKAVDQASFELEAKSTLVIQGPSGSGKTTLLRLIAGLDLPDRGSVKINGETVSSPQLVLPPHQRQLGFVFQAPALWPHLTVTGNILFGLTGRSKQEKAERLDKLLEYTGLVGLEKRFPDQLSGGEARRVSLARALAPEPSCLLMDEPLTNIDHTLKKKLLKMIMVEVARLDAALIFVTHDKEEAAVLGGQLAIMEEGRLKV